MLLPNLAENKASTGGQGQCPPGLHLMRATEVKDVGPNSNGNSGVQVTWSAIQGDHAGTVARDNFTLVSTSGANVKVGRDRIKGLLTILGLPADGGIDSALIAGHVAMVRVVHEDYTPEPGRTIKTAKVTGYDKAQAQPQQAAAAPVVVDASSVPF